MKICDRCAGDFFDNVPSDPLTFLQNETIEIIDEHSDCCSMSTEKLNKMLFISKLKSVSNNVEVLSQEEFFESEGIT